MRECKLPRPKRSAIVITRIVRETHIEAGLVDLRAVYLSMLILCNDLLHLNEGCR